MTPSSKITEEMKKGVTANEHAIRGVSAISVILDEMDTRQERIEKAIIWLADACEDPMHDQYLLKTKVLDMLSLEEVEEEAS